MKSNNFEYIPAVDQIQGFAAIWIVIYHYFFIGSHQLKLGSLFTASTPLSAYLSYTFNPFYSVIASGHTAVSLFMVLSGFIFAYGASDRDVSYLGFLRNRILRVYPLWVVLIFFGVFTTQTPVTLVTLIEALLPIGLRSAAAPWTPFIAMHWSLVLEFQFYLVFPLLMAASQKIGMQRLAFSVLGALIFLRLLASAFGADNLHLAYYTILGRADQLILGMLLADFYKRGWPSKKLATYLLPVTVFVVILLMMIAMKKEWAGSKSWLVSFRMTIEGVIWVTLIGSYLRLADRAPKFISNTLEKFGEISFSIYMLHISIIWVICTKNLWIRLGFGVEIDLIFNFFILVLPWTLVLANLSYNAFEKPFLMLRTQYLKPHTERS